MRRHDSYYVYMIQDRKGTYYSGYTRCLEARLDLHRRGRGAKYLRGRSPLQLVYYKQYRYFRNALLAEQRLKKLTRDRKENLIRIFEAKRDAGPRRFAKQSETAGASLGLEK